MPTRFLVAAPSSGSGKTTVTRALMAALVQRGLRVQPFKCGPDYIDTKFHTAVCGRPSINLDTFLASPEHVRNLFARYAAEAEACIVEGMMGLFDGYDRARGSSAEIAKLLRLPVVLVVDARHAAYSLAPLLRGFAAFDQSLTLAGVLFNQVGSLRHERLLRQACSDAGLTCLGCLPRRCGLEQPSRYLGLDFAQAFHDDGWAQWMEDHADVAALCCLTQTSPSNPLPITGKRKSTPLPNESTIGVSSASQHSPLPVMGRGLGGGPSHIVVARSHEAFSFIYQEHLDLLAACGHVSFINPAHDYELPADTSLLYLPGGYPEQHADALQANTRMRRSIHQYTQDGGRILAECGGMIYLCDKLLTDHGSYELCGVLPYTISARTADRHLSLGYRQLTYNGLALRGHEFHYTQFATATLPPTDITVCDAHNTPTTTPFFRHHNVLASYTHLYWGELGTPFQLFA